MDPIFQLYITVQLLLLQGLDLYRLLPEVTQGGLVVVLFIIWWTTFKRGNEMHDNITSQANELFGRANKHSQDLFLVSLKKHEELNEKLLEVIRANNSDAQKERELLTGVLTRLESLMKSK